jgi:hypothetical protein
LKIKNVAQICKHTKTVYLLENDADNPCQWIGNGKAFYPVTGLPLLNEESIYTIFDIPEKQRDKWFYSYEEMPVHISFEDTVQEEYQIEKYNLSISYNGMQLRSLHTFNGIVFIESQYLSPLVNVLDNVEFYVRKKPSGEIYIVAKTGFLIAAVIMPEVVLTDDFMDLLDKLKSGCETAREYASRRKVDQKSKQIPYDKETGEIIDQEGRE